jgi:hypothetical protein
MAASIIILLRRYPFQALHEHVHNSPYLDVAEWHADATQGFSTLSWAMSRFQRRLTPPLLLEN